ncbi:MAG: methyltransferase domain-containing protein [Candidatus Riesia sp.]|nr:methyltransferase domain-containing protein [Candidatus Riesia sp.]
MEHNLFKPKSFHEGQHAVVGDCNGFSMQQRWDEETPAFAKAIYRNIPVNGGARVLDYGCGVGRLSKALVDLDECGNIIEIIGTDASQDMMNHAFKYVNSIKFSTRSPEVIRGKFDLIYLVYVLQHVPSVEIRDVLSRIHYLLKEDGVFVYCSSDYRMAIRFDGQGFFDDRFLGVDLLSEVSRFFDVSGPLLSDDEIRDSSVLSAMMIDGLKHPSFVMKKKRVDGQYFNVPKEVVSKDNACKSETKHGNHLVACENIVVGGGQDGLKPSSKILLINRLAPGDILVMTNALRDLKLARPDYEIDVRTPCNQIFDNNPHITPLIYNEQEYREIINEFSRRTHGDCERLISAGKYGEFIRHIGDVAVIDMHYPLIHTSGTNGWHFGYGHREWLERVLGIEIPQNGIRPEIYLNGNEKDWISPVHANTDHIGPYWVINAGSKDDYTLKQYPYYQEVIDLFNEHVSEHKIVQVGLRSHQHAPLNGVIDMRGKTDNVRDLFRVISRSVGVISCVSFHMHIAAAFNKPCVVVAGAREGTRWELYPNHQFLYVNGCLPCATYDGCWKSKHAECNNKKDEVPMCMNLIRPEDVFRAMQRYYEGGMIELEVSA